MVEFLKYYCINDDKIGHILIMSQACNSCLFIDLYLISIILLFMYFTIHDAKAYISIQDNIHFLTTICITMTKYGENTFQLSITTNGRVKTDYQI